MKRLTIPLFLLTLTAACGQSKAAPAATKQRNIEPCSVLVRTDVEWIFGALKGDPKASEGLSHEECRYENLDGQWLKTSVYGADRWELQKGITSEQHPTALSLGDEAFAVKPGTDSVVYVRKGDAVVEVSCSCGMEKTQKLAAKAVQKF